MADVSGTVTAAWGGLAVTLAGSDVKAGVVTLDWGGLTVTADTAPRDHDGTVTCAWGE